MIRTESFERSVLDHGKVSLIDWMGGDLDIVRAAQASFDNEAQFFGAPEKGILNFLMREEHGVPFEHVVLKFKMRMPLFLAAQFKKHRMSSWSEQSGRYDELERTYYVPALEDWRTQVGKPGAYTFETMDPVDARYQQIKLRSRSEEAFDDYEKALDDGVAKELARLYLLPNTYTNIVWTLNVRSLFNVIRLRADVHAQREAQRYGQAFEDLARIVIPETVGLFVASGRPKP